MGSLSPTTDNMVPQSEAKESKSAKSKSKSKSNGESDTKKEKKVKKHESDPIDDEAGGACQFPMSRVRRLVRTDDPTTRTTPDSIFLINKASVSLFLSLFLSHFLSI